MMACLKAYAVLALSLLGMGTAMRVAEKYSIAWKM